MRKEIKYLIFAIFLPIIVFSCSKSGTDGSDCVNTLCTAGHAECMGNYKAVCQMDQRGWVLTFCGVRGYCENGACKKGVCEPGLRYCDNGRAIVCDETGTKQETITCEDGQTCQYGFCMERRCKDGSIICNNNEMLVCAGGLWSTQQCASDESCNPEQKTCMKRMCTPFLAVCSKDRTESNICNNNGSGYKIIKCRSNETCKDGFCIKNLCAPTHDTVIHEDMFKDAEVIGADTSKRDGTVHDLNTDTTTNLVNRAEINGAQVEFTVKHESSFNSSEHKLRVALKAGAAGIGTQSQNQVTIMLSGIQENQTGTFHCQDQGVVRVNMYYKSGKYPSDGDCAEYDYIATKCTVTITKFGMRQGLVSGTFSAPVMEDCKQDNSQSVIKNGQFNTIRIF